MPTTLTSPRSTDRTPSGRESWKDAINQVEGNLEWMLGFLTPEEVIERIAKIESRRHETTKNSLVENYQNLIGLTHYHSQMQILCSEKVEKMEGYLTEDYLEEKRSFVEVAIRGQR